MVPGQNKKGDPLILPMIDISDTAQVPTVDEAVKWAISGEVYQRSEVTVRGWLSTHKKLTRSRPSA